MAQSMVSVVIDPARQCGRGWSISGSSNAPASSNERTERDGEEDVGGDHDAGSCIAASTAAIWASSTRVSIRTSLIISSMSKRRKLRA